mgnify:CR=1 FL=1
MLLFNVEPHFYPPPPLHPIFYPHQIIFPEWKIFYCYMKMYLILVFIISFHKNSKRFEQGLKEHLNTQDLPLPLPPSTPSAVHREFF